MSGLSIEQQDVLIKAVLAPDDDCAHNMVPLFAAVERIRDDAVAEMQERVTRWESAIHDYENRAFAAEAAERALVEKVEAATPHNE